MKKLKALRFMAVVIMALLLFTGTVYAGEGKSFEVFDRELRKDFALNPASRCEVLLDGELIGFMYEPWTVSQAIGTNYFVFKYRYGNYTLVTSYNGFGRSVIDDVNAGISKLTYRWVLDPAIETGSDYCNKYQFLRNQINSLKQRAKNGDIDLTVWPYKEALNYFKKDRKRFGSYCKALD